MKKGFYYLLLGISFSLTRCAPDYFDKIEYLEYSIVKQDVVDYAHLDKLNPILGDFKDFLLFLDKKLIFRVAALSYPTVDPNGKEVIASGLVFHPVSKKSKGVIDFMPTAHMDSEGGGTDELYAVEGILILMGYTVIIPDLLGSGISKDMPIPFLFAENTGRVAYDMRRAAAQYLWDEFRYQIPSQTIIMGYSLGGSAALAAQKYYETRHSNRVKVKEVYASSGAYDLEIAFKVFAKTGFSDYPSIPNIILGFKHYYFDERGQTLDLSQIFTGELLANYANWFGGTYTSPEIMEMLGSNLHAYLHEDFFKPYEQQNPAFQSLYPYLKENTLIEGWSPKAPITMTHATVDSYVPTACADAAVKNFRRAGTNISYITYPGNHLTTGYLWFIRSIFHFL